MSAPANAKARHYAALSSRLRQLSANLAESEEVFPQLADRLGDMTKLGVSAGAQFMAVSRLLDVEIEGSLARDQEPQQPAQA